MTLGVPLVEVYRLQQIIKGGKIQDLLQWDSHVSGKGKNFLHLHKMFQIYYHVNWLCWEQVLELCQWRISLALHAWHCTGVDVGPEAIRGPCSRAGYISKSDILCYFQLKILG